MWNLLLCPQLSCFAERYPVSCGAARKGTPRYFLTQALLSLLSMWMLVVFCQVVTLRDLHCATMLPLDMKKWSLKYHYLLAKLFDLFLFCVFQWSRWPSAHFVLCGLAQWTPSASLWMCCTGRVHPWGVSPWNSALTHPFQVCIMKYA